MCEACSKAIGAPATQIRQCRKGHKFHEACAVAMVNKAECLDCKHSVCVICTKSMGTGQRIKGLQTLRQTDDGAIYLLACDHAAHFKCAKSWADKMPHATGEEIPCLGCMPDCLICFDKNDEPVVTSCGHLYCNPCLGEWLTRANSCATCNHEFPPVPSAPLQVEEEQLNWDRLREEDCAARAQDSDGVPIDPETAGQYISDEPGRFEYVDGCLREKPVVMPQQLPQVWHHPPPPVHHHHQPPSPRRGFHMNEEGRWFLLAVGAAVGAGLGLVCFERLYQRVPWKWGARGEWFGQLTSQELTRFTWGRRGALMAGAALGSGLVGNWGSAVEGRDSRHLWTLRWFATNMAIAVVGLTCIGIYALVQKAIASIRNFTLPTLNFIPRLPAIPSLSGLWPGR